MTQPITRAPFYEPVPEYMKRLSMMGARFIEGNTGEGSDGDNDGSEGEETPQEGETPDTPPAEKSKLEDASKEELLEEVRLLRRENAKDRTSAKEKAAQDAQQELIDKLAGALGFKQDGDEAPSVDDLTAQLQQEQEARRSQSIEFEAWRQAADIGVDANALLNLRSFHEAVAQLDPNSDTFKADVKAAIENEKKNSSFIAKAPSRSSNPLNQHKGSDGEGTGSKSPEELAASITEKSPY